MKNKILSYLLGWVFAVILGFWWIWWSYVGAEGWSDECNWIKLNTKFPIIWNCIESKDATKAFPTMMWALAKIVVSLILVVCFIFVIYAGILWAADKPKDAKPILRKVVITVLLLWFSWAILRLINPNFFGS